MNFSVALTHLKGGQRIFRKGWNGKDMYLFLNPTRKVSGAETPLGGVTREVEVRILGHILMKTTIGDIVPWTASQTDILAEDWQLVPSGRIIEAPVGDNTPDGKGAA